MILLAIASTCPETIRIGQFTPEDIRNTQGIHEGCTRRHLGEPWCAYKITKISEGNYHVICRPQAATKEIVR